MITFLKKIAQIAAIVSIFMVASSCKKDKIKAKTTELTFSSVVATAQMNFKTLGIEHDFKCHRVEDFDEIVMEDSTILELNLRTKKQEGNGHKFPYLKIKIRSTKGFKKGDIFKVSDYYPHRSVLFSTILNGGISNQYLATNYGQGFGYGELEILHIHENYIKGRFNYYAEKPQDTEDVVELTNGQFEGEIIYSN